MPNDVQVKLNKSIVGQELKYSELCKALGLQPKSGNSKRPQIEIIRQYCELEEIKDSYPTKYIIKQIYPYEIIALQSNLNNKFQIFFDAMLYQALLNNNDKPLYLSIMELLKLFKEVNDNFSYACNSDHMWKLSVLTNQDYTYMTSIGQIVYRILSQWTKRRLKQMADRDIIILRQGYRLYRYCDGQFGQYIKSHNVIENSQEERMCMTIYAKAIDEIMPEDWKEGDWVAEWRWKKFENRMQQLTKEITNGEYFNTKHILIISPPNKIWLKDRLDEIYQDYPVLNEINDEACRKILATKQLDKATGEQRKMFVALNMAQDPPFNIADKLREFDEQLLSE